MTQLKKFGLFVLMCFWVGHAYANDREIFNRAVQLSKQGQWQQAAELYQQLATRNPQWPEPKNNLAVCFFNLGKTEQAQKALDASVTSRNSFSIAQNNRQKFYDYLAAQAYSKALSQKTSAPAPVLELIDVLDAPAAPAAVAPAPVSAAPVASGAAMNTAMMMGVESRVNDWAQAWSRGDVKNYLSAYSQAFRSDDGKSFDQWANNRRQKLQSGSGITVDVQDLHVYADVSRQQVIAEFIQSYTSSTYRDRTLKQLLLVMEENSWRIAAERVMAQLP